MSERDHVHPSRNQADAAGRPASAEPPPLPAGVTAPHAFVIRISSDCALAPGDFRGRVQHLSSVDGGNFSSVEGLIAIMRRILAHRDAEPRCASADE